MSVTYEAHGATPVAAPTVNWSFTPDAGVQADDIFVVTVFAQDTDAQLTLPTGAISPAGVGMVNVAEPSTGDVSSVFLWRATSTSTAPVPLAISTAAQGVVSWARFRGVRVASPMDGFSQRRGIASNWTAETITTTGPNRYILAGIIVDAGASVDEISGPGGWTALNGTTLPRKSVISLKGVQETAGATGNSTPWSYAPNPNWTGPRLAWQMALVPADEGGGPVDPIETPMIFRGDGTPLQAFHLRPDGTLMRKNALFGDALLEPSPFPPGTQPASSTYPNETVTGWQPTGVVLATQTTGTMLITASGDIVLDGIDHRGIIHYRGTGSLTIRRSRLINTDNWVVRRQAPASGGSAGHVTIEDCELDGNNRGDGGAVVYGGYTIRRCNIHHFGEGPRMGGNSIIEDSWIHHLLSLPPNHADAIQSTGGSAGVIIRRCRVESYNPDEDTVSNACYQYGEEDGPLRNSLVEYNYLNGGNYTINGRGGGTNGAEVTFRHNKFGRKFRYGIRNLSLASTWDSATNVWEDTGLPVPGGAIPGESTWSGAGG